MLSVYLSSFKEFLSILDFILIFNVICPISAVNRLFMPVLVGMYGDNGKIQKLAYDLKTVFLVIIVPSFLSFFSVFR